LLVTTNVTKAQSLAALLANAINSVDRNNPTAAINQLQAFQNQVNAQIAPLDPALAQILITDAQNIIDVLSGTAKNSKNSIPLFVRVAHGRAYLGFSSVHQKTYSIESSSDLSHWTNAGPAQEVLEGAFEFNDVGATNANIRFYRVVTP
jgi:FIMAH domain